MMGETVKAYLNLSAEAFQVLERQATPRKRGEFISRLLLQYGAVDSGVDAVDNEMMKMQMLGLASANKSIEARVMKLERQLAAVMSHQ